MCVYIKEYTDIEIDKSEILRYARLPANCDFSAVDECIRETDGIFSYKVCYSFFDITHYDSYTDLGFCKTESKDLIKNLKDCNGIILFCASVGFEIDRLIYKYNRISPSKSLITGAIGSQKVESLCNRFNNEMKEKFNLKPRFSPGYGDLPIEIQKDIFSVLNPYKHIGVSLNGEMLMSPSKSVTAIIGTVGEKQN